MSRLFVKEGDEEISDIGAAWRHVVQAGNAKRFDIIDGSGNHLILVHRHIPHAREEFVCTAEKDDGRGGYVRKFVSAGLDKAMLKLIHMEPG